MVKINDVCPMPKSIDLSDDKGGIVGAASDFGVIMQKTVSAKSDDQGAVKNDRSGVEKNAVGDDNDVQENEKDVTAKPTDDNADLIAAMCLNIQDMSQPEQLVQTAEVSSNEEISAVDAADVISDNAVAEVTDIQPEMTAGQTYMPAVNSDFAEITDKHDDFVPNQNTVREDITIIEQPTDELSTAAETNAIVRPTAEADEYAALTEPQDNAPSSVSDNSPNDIAQQRPVVDMYNRKVYLDGLDEADNTEYDGNIANVDANLFSQPKIQNENTYNEIPDESGDVKIQPIEQTGITEKSNAENAVDADSTDDRLTYNADSSAAVYSGFTVNSAENNVSFEKVSQAESVKNQIVSEIYDKFNAGQTDFQIEINPHELGTVTVKMAVKGSELVIELIAHDSKAQNIIISNSNEIKSILQDQLNQNVTVEVVRDDNQAQSYDEAQSQNAHPQQQEQERRENDDDSNKNFTVDFLTLMQTFNKK